MLKPEVSVPVALATGTLVYAIYQNATPPVADIRSLPQGNAHVDSAERSAAWISAGVVAGISLVTGDPTVFTFGALVVIGMSVWTRHANYVQPDINRLAPGLGAGTPPTSTSTGATDDAVPTGAAPMDTEAYQTFGSDMAFVAG